MHDELMRRLRLGDLQRLVRSRYGHTLPNDDAGTEDLIEMLLPISLGNNPEDRMRRTIEIWAPWVSPALATEVIDLVNSVPTAKAAGHRCRCPHALHPGRPPEAYAANHQAVRCV